MAGHSKWASIKHKKKAVDAKRGQLFTKLTRAITVAAREGGGEPEGNPALALAIQKARDASMPKDNIERAVAKGTGADSEGETYESVVYEGYGPGGVAILVEALTDNRNRTGSEVRHLFTKSGGEPGRARLGGLDLREEGRGGGGRAPLLRGRPARGHRRGRGGRVARRRPVGDRDGPGRARSACARRSRPAGVELESAELVMRPTTRTPVEEEQVGSLMRLIEGLEDHDDVQAVHANFDVDADVLERVAAV